MSRGRCSPEARAACPLMQKRCFSDEHHLLYESRDYKTKTEKEFRELPFNKVQICRALHNAIHASGYFPDKPDRNVMLQELQATRPTIRALEERTTQLAIGQAVMQSEPNYFKKDIA